MMLYEMMAGHPPFQGEDEEELFSTIVTSEVRYPRIWTKEAKEICKGVSRKDDYVVLKDRENIFQFLMKNPAKRLGFVAEDEQIKTHSFFKRIDWAKLEAREVQPPIIPKLVGILK